MYKFGLFLFEWSIRYVNLLSVTLKICFALGNPRKNQFNNKKKEQLRHNCSRLCARCCRLISVMTGDAKMGICCFKAKHTEFVSKSKDCLGGSVSIMYSNRVTGLLVDCCFSQLVLEKYN